jgi:hypothetical protein
MKVVALVLWVVTAVGGLTMAGIWLASGGRSQHRAGVSRISPHRLGGHFALAAGGLVLWIAFVATGSKALAWPALVALPVAASLGALMFLTWLGGGGAAVATEQPAENRFPVALVAAHGVFAVLTLVAVIVAVAT